MTHETDVAIVGSGPYGLSIAAQLRARGVEFRIFGPPMKFWRDMPAGINLKSFAFATNVYVPIKGHTFPEWCRTQGLEDFEPCTMASFAAYGMGMQARFVPNIETVEVKRVSLAGGGHFDLVLGSGEQVRARRVVFATGLTHLEYLPSAVASLPQHLATHTGHLTDYSVFRGKEVVVLGAGASAIEAGAMVHEAGGRAQILVRENEAIFHGRMDVNRSLYERLRKPVSVIGPGMKNRIFQALPLALHFVPERRRVRFIKGYLGPAAPWWIKDRVDGVVPIFTRTSVVAAEPTGQRVRLRLQVEGQSDRINRGRSRHRGDRLRAEPRPPRLSRRRPSSAATSRRTRSLSLDELRVLRAGRVLLGAGRGALVRAPLPLRLRRRVRGSGAGAPPRGARAAGEARVATPGRDRPSTGLARVESMSVAPFGRPVPTHSPGD